MALLPLAVAGGCGGPPDAPKIAKTAGSWGATAQLATDRWERGAVPRKFTVLTLDRAGAELESVAQQVTQLPDTTAARATLVSTLARIRSAIAALSSAAARDDRAGAARAAPRLASAAAQLDTLREQLEQQQQQQQRRGQRE